MTPAIGQVIGGVDSRTASQYVWRGITVRNAWVWQPDVYVALQADPAIATLGVWTNVELTKASSAIPEALGYGTRVGEGQVWLEMSVQKRALEVAAGFVHTDFSARLDTALHNPFGDRSELYGRIVVSPGRFTLGGYVWHTVADDSTSDRPTYVEGRASWYVPVLPAGIPLVRFGAVVGWQQDSPYHARGPRGTKRQGVTHWELFAETQLSVGVAGAPFYALPGIHVIRAVDAATRRVDRAGGTAGVKAWIGMTLSFQHR